LQEEEA